MLNHAYQESLEAAARETLRGQIYLLLGAAEPGAKGIKMPSNLPEPRYSTVSSGLVGWIENTDHKIKWRSRSGELLNLAAAPPIDIDFNPGLERFFDYVIDNKTYYAISYDTLWDINEQEEGFRFVVMQSREPMRKEAKAYQKRLWKWLGGLALLLILVQTLIARWGLSPLRQLASDLEHVEAGQQQDLKGVYPAEIQPVTNNLNRVLRSEQAQRDRYRNTLADLAHSLKTPLAVIRGQLQSDQLHNLDQLKTLVDEQISRMSAIVDHQLRRASAQVVQTGRTSVKLQSVVERLCNAMQRVYTEKQLHLSVEIPDDIHFEGDEGDLMELLGNIIDNACKYGRHSVKVSAIKLNNDLQITIEDDGNGIAENIKQIILTRGARADTASPGQGIGLAVAVDILSSYGGALEINRSSLGGACFLIRIPH
jgi:two-component system, OmpR family, sensor histidine kinase PhoQ